MQEKYIFLIIAFIFIGLSFIVPQMMKLRIKILRFIHWYKLADWHERHQKVINAIGRYLLLGLGIFMLIMYFYA